MNQAKHFWRRMIAVAALAAISGAALAHKGATGVVLERMNGMLNLARAVETLSGAVDRPAPNRRAIVAAAGVIQEHAGEQMTALFPPDSIMGPSQATPEVWARWAEFAELAADLGQLGSELAVAATAGDIPGSATVTPPDELIAPVRQQPQDMWSSLDERLLLGLQPVLEAKRTDAPMAKPAQRPVREVFGDITDTCASCHESFRRSTS